MNRASLALLAPIAAISQYAALGAQCPYSWPGGSGIPGVDQPYALAITDWDLDGPGPAPAVVVIGGLFQYAGTTFANSIVAYEPQGGTWSPLGTGIDGTVWAVAPTASGLCVGGSFSSAGGVPCASLARWNGFSWSPVGGGVDGYVAALAVAPNGDLVVGGTFSHAGGVPVHNLARWNGTSWSGIGGGAGPWVQALAFAPNGDLVIGGWLDDAGGTPVGNLARWDGAAWSAIGGGTDGTVAALAFVPNGDLYVGGTFTMAGSTISRALARWDGSTWQPLAGLGAPSWLGQQEVRGLAVAANGDVVATGAMQIGNAAVGALRFVGGASSVVADGECRAVHDVPGIGFVVGGGDSGVGKLDPTLVPLGRGIDGHVAVALRSASGAHYLAGGFRWLDGVAASNIARIDGTTVTPLGAGFNTSCKVLLERANGNLVAGGQFTSAGAVPANHVAEWDGSSWSGLAGGVNGQVNALLELSNGDLLVGGQFLQTGQGLLSGAIAKFDGVTWTAQGFNLGAGPVFDMCQLPNGDLIAAGNLPTVGNVARWNGSSWVVLGGGTNGTVQSLTVLADGRLVAAGNFTAAGGVFAMSAAVWDGAAWQQLGFGLGGPVADVIELPNGTLCAVGPFSPQGVAFLPRSWNAWVTYGLVPQLSNGYPWSVTADPDGALLVCGSFERSTNGSSYLMRATPGCGAEVHVEGSGCVGAAGPVALASDNLPWLGTTYRSTGTGVPAGSLVVLVRSTATASSSLPAVFPQAGIGCDLLVVPELLSVLLPTGNEVHAELVLPDNTWFLGVDLHEQIVPFAFGPAGLTAVNSSNALRLTLGTL